MKYKVTLAYDGSEFLGWQKQSSERSVQEELETILSKIAKEEVRVHGSGRTDAKVHALAQTCHFESDVDMDHHAWRRALNALVPKDIYIKLVQRVSHEFHAQYHTLSKTYEYRLNQGEYNPFMRNYVYQYGKKLDTQAIRDLMKIFVGTHDFTSFNATELTVVENQVRTIEWFNLNEEDDLLIFRIKGSGFLRYMVRMLIAACIEVGRGKLSVEDVNDMLLKKDKRAFARNAEPCGLYMCEVEYEEGWIEDESI